MDFSFFLFARQEERKVRKERRSTQSFTTSSLRSAKKLGWATHKGKHNITCRPEFISGPNQFGVGLETDKMLKQVQHDDIFVVAINIKTCLANKKKENDK